MSFKIDDVFRSPFSQLIFSAICCCVISYDVSLVVHHGTLHKGAFVVVCIGAVLLVAWLIWFFRMYLGGYTITIMPKTSLRICEWIDLILSAIWIMITIWTKVAHPVWVIVSWCLFIISLIYYFISSGKMEDGDRQ